jgi:hypothetical protein
MGSDHLQEFVVVFHVFHHVKQTDGGETIGKKCSVLQCGPHHVLNSPPPGIRSAHRPGLYQNYFESRILHGLCHEAVTTAYVKQGTRRGILSHRFEDAGVAMTEPERRIFDLEADLIPPFGV